MTSEGGPGSRRDASPAAPGSTPAVLAGPTRLAARLLRRGVLRTRLAFDRGLTLGVLLERLAAADPDRVLVDEVGGPRLTVGEAADQVDRWAAAIAERSGTGEVVVVATPNGYEQFLLCLAASRAGRVPAPVNDRMPPEEVEGVVADAGASLVVRAVADLPVGPPLGSAHRADPGEVAAVFYTSGTTGRPKGAELTHRGILDGLHLAALLPAGIGRGDWAVVSLPIAHIMGFVAAVGLAYAAVPARFLPRFDAGAVLDEIEGRRAWIYIGVPAMYRMLLDAGAAQRDLRSVRLWISGADAMPADLADRFSRLGALVSLPGLGPVGRAAFAEGYGLVETAGSAAARIDLPFLPPALSRVGLPLPGYRTRVVDEGGAPVGRGEVGELQVQGPGVLRGYRGDAEATRGAFTDDGWLRTGDLVRRGPVGVFTFEGRAKDVIVRGGYNVYAVEVEQALERHPAVAEAAVVGRPDDRLGEVPVAAVRLVPGASLDPDDLREWARGELSSYKVPVRVLVVDALPQSGTRKVRRAEVRSLFGSEP